MNVSIVSFSRLQLRRRGVYRLSGVNVSYLRKTGGGVEQGEGKTELIESSTS